MQNVFIISSKADSARRRMLVERFKAVGCAVNFVDAVMADALTDAEKHPFLEAKSQYYARYAPRNTAIGCSISHFKAWAMIAKSAAGYGFIFEHDALPIPETAHHVESVLARLGDLSKKIDVVSLHNSHPHRPQTLIHKLDGRFNLSVVKFNAHTAVAYMMSKAAAQKLLNDPYRYVLGVDRVIYNWGLNGCDVMHLSTSLFCEDEQPSTTTPIPRVRWAVDRWYHKLGRAWWILYSSLAKRLRLLLHTRRMRGRFD